MLSNRNASRRKLAAIYGEVPLGTTATTRSGDVGTVTAIDDEGNLRVQFRGSIQGTYAPNEVTLDLPSVEAAESKWQTEGASFSFAARDYPELDDILSQPSPVINQPSSAGTAKRVSLWASRKTASNDGTCDYCGGFGMAPGGVPCPECGGSGHGGNGGGFFEPTPLVDPYGGVCGGCGAAPGEPCDDAVHDLRDKMGSKTADHGDDYVLNYQKGQNGHDPYAPIREYEYEHDGGTRARRIRCTAPGCEWSLDSRGLRSGDAVDRWVEHAQEQTDQGR